MIVTVIEIKAHFSGHSGSESLKFPSKRFGGTVRTRISTFHHRLQKHVGHHEIIGNLVQLTTDAGELGTVTIAAISQSHKKTTKISVEGGLFVKSKHKVLFTSAHRPYIVNVTYLH